MSHVADEVRWKLGPASAAGRRRPNIGFLNHGCRWRSDPPQTVHRDPMLVAVRDLDVTFYGERVVIQAGRDRVRASHWICRAHPDAFEPDTGTGR